MTGLIVLFVFFVLPILFAVRTLWVSLSFRCFRMLSSGRWTASTSNQNSFDRNNMYTFHNNDHIVLLKRDKEWKAQSGEAIIDVHSGLCEMGVRRGISKKMTGDVTRDMAAEIL